MLVEVRVPMLAESVAEATLMDWHKQPGDAVKFGDVLIDIETDKVTLEIVAPEDGTLAEVLKNGGEDVASNELLAQIDTGGDATASSPAAPESRSQEQPAAPEPAAVPEKTQQSLLADVADSAAPPPAAGTSTDGVTTSPKLSPAVRNLLREHNLEVGEIPIQGDRLTKKAVLNFLKDRQQQTAVSKPAAPAETPLVADPAAPTEAPAPADAAAPTETSAGADQAEQQPPAPDRKPATRAATEAVAPPTRADEKRVPMTRLRRRAAERLLAAQRENAILTTFNEVNMKPVLDLRQRYRESFEQAHHVKLGFMSFFTKAVVEALRKFPLLNASVDGTDIVYHDYFDVGIAVSSPRGLVVPVLRAADRLSFAEIEKNISAYGQKARDAKLTIEDLSGGTFTITNGGVFGSLLSTPIINPPQSAILGMHKIEERPIAQDGAVVIRPMMYLALSYDHRIIDGREAVSFLVTVKEALEDPSRLLLQI